MRLSPLRCGMFAAALGTITTGAGAVPAPASADTQGTPAATIAKVGVAKQRLDVHSGRTAVVVGSARPAAKGLTASLQIHRDGRWYTIARDRTAASGRYVLRDRRKAPMSARVRVRLHGGGDRAHRRIGRLNVYRTALASWYGPGFFGQQTGCGGTLGTSQMGVAHKSLPCGTKVTLRHQGHVVRVPVIDRGPYVGAREYDLTAVTARKLGFRGYGGIQTTR